MDALRMALRGWLTTGRRLCDMRGNRKYLHVIGHWSTKKVSVQSSMCSKVFSISPHGSALHLLPPPLVGPADRAPWAGPEPSGERWGGQAAILAFQLLLFQTMNDKYYSEPFRKNIFRIG